ncbi:MAG: hypothetical protein FWH01_09110 [Oscillospiraceae bacterium]|nr:hypothetical protein [Oscillospiraceae bacterium]
MKKRLTGFAAFAYAWFSRLRAVWFFDSDLKSDSANKMSTMMYMKFNLIKKDRTQNTSAKLLMNLFRLSCPYLPYKNRL